MDGQAAASGQALKEIGKYKRENARQEIFPAAPYFVFRSNNFSFDFAQAQKIGKADDPANAAAKSKKRQQGKPFRKGTAAKKR